MILFLLMILFCLAACGIDTNIKDAKADDTVLRIGTTRDTPIYSYVNKQGELEGFDIDVIKEISKRLNMKSEFYFTTQDSKFAGLNSKRFDVAVGRNLIDDKVGRSYTFSDQYKNINISILVNKNTKDINNLNDIIKKNTATTATSVFGKIALLQKAGVVKVENVEQEFEALKQQKIAFLIEDDDTINYFNKNETDNNFKVTANIPVEYGLGVLLRSSDKNLRDSINTQIHNMENDGTLKMLSDKWFR